MKLLDRTLPTPAENLAGEEALLEMCEAGEGAPLLRFWEPREYFVVVGYGNRVGTEVNQVFCQERGIPILRRCSGGGTVLQGPGCLNYCLVLPTDNPPELRSIHSTNRYVMEQNRAALQTAAGQQVEIQGHSDLVIGRMKFSGNAQRRRLHFLIFHGCFLLHMDLGLIEQALPMPTKQPEYREHRTHQAFLRNLEIPAETIKTSLAQAWDAHDLSANLPGRLIESLVREKYGNPDWNLKF